MTPWTVAHKSPLFMGFPMQEHWSGWHFVFPGAFPDTGIELVSPALADRFLITELPEKPCHPAYLTSMQSASCEMLGWMKHKLESRLLGEISINLR